jgi:hypothetical protein
MELGLVLGELRRPVEVGLGLGLVLARFRYRTDHTDHTAWIALPDVG